MKSPVWGESEGDGGSAPSTSSGQAPRPAVLGLADDGYDFVGVGGGEQWNGVAFDGLAVDGEGGDGFGLTVRGFGW